MSRLIYFLCLGTLAVWADAKSEFPIFVSDCCEEVSEKAFVRGVERDSSSLNVESYQFAPLPFHK